MPQTSLKATCLALLLLTVAKVVTSERAFYARSRRNDEDLQCGEEITTTDCDCSACFLHNSTWLADKCCEYQGIPASLLAFEREDLWIPRLKEFNACTGARVQLTYNGENGVGDEDSMEDDLRQDVGVSYAVKGGRSFEEAGAGIYDAYIVQPPWLPAIVDGLENLSPWISENSVSIGWSDVNPASRESVAFSGTVRALPLDTDYVALGYRQDVYEKAGLDPPETLEDLVEHSEILNGKDHNEDGVPDWGYCLSPQVNYLLAFVAPVLQTHAECTGDDECFDGYTEQNIFFDARNFEPYLDHEGFKYAVRLFSRLVRSSNCQEQLGTTGGCDRRTAFPTGRCAGVISMPGTMTQLLLPDGKYSIDIVRDGVKWVPQTDTGIHWGRRIRFPGSSMVYNHKTHQLEPCTPTLCPKALPSAKKSGTLINYGPFFAEGGECYSVRGGTADSKKAVMLDFFGWLSTLPVTRLPLSGQYRQSHLDDEQKQVLLDDGWPSVMVEDLFSMLDLYFDEEKGNQVQDLLMLGFSEYQGALADEIFLKFLLDDAFFRLSDEEWEEQFDVRFSQFLEAILTRYNEITNKYGRLQQLERWRSSLSLAPIPLETLCQDDKLALEDDCVALRQSSSSNDNEWAVILAIVMVVAFVLFVAGALWVRKHRQETMKRQVFAHAIKKAQQKVHDEMVQRFGYDRSLSSRYESLKITPAQVTFGRELGRGAFGVVHLGQFESAGESKQVAIKRLNDGVPTDEQDTFLYECRLLAMLDHPHIIKIVAVQVDVAPILLLTEVMEQGSLTQVLRNTTAAEVTTNKLYNILARVADACVYLTTNNIVHRDIAARNVLVGEALDDVRLSDFGMSRLMTNTDYYRKKSDDMVPIKWMPLEAIEKKIFTAASDVWAWGVLAWEVMTLGTTPWASYSAVETALAIAKGERLSQPSLADEDLYRLMKRCWQNDPDDRPTFRRILRFFRGRCSAMPQTSTMSGTTTDLTSDGMNFSEFAKKLEDANAANRSKSSSEAASHSVGKTTTFSVEPNHKRVPVSNPDYTSLSHLREADTLHEISASQVMPTSSTTRDEDGSQVQDAYESYADVSAADTYSGSLDNHSHADEHKHVNLVINDSGKPLAGGSGDNLSVPTDSLHSNSVDVAVVERESQVHESTEDQGSELYENESGGVGDDVDEDEFKFGSVPGLRLVSEEDAARGEALEEDAKVERNAHLPLSNQSDGYASINPEYLQSAMARHLANAQVPGGMQVAAKPDGSAEASATKSFPVGDNAAGVGTNGGYASLNPNHVQAVMAQQLMEARGRHPDALACESLTLPQPQSLRSIKGISQSVV